MLGTPRKRCGEIPHLFLRDFLFFQDGGELIDEDGVVAVGAGGDHADGGAGFLLHEAEILLRLLGELAVFGGSEGVLLPAGEGV